MEAAMSEKSVIIYIVSFCESIDYKKLKLFFIPFHDFQKEAQGKDNRSKG